MRFEPLPGPPVGFPTTRFATWEDLEAFISVPGWSREDLGPASDPNLRVHGFRLGDFTSKPTVFIEANIHGGHEWRSTHWAVLLMRYLAGLEEAPIGPTRRVLERMRAAFDFYVVPSLNPWGYLFSTSNRCNGNGVNLNQNWPTIYWDDAVPDGNCYNGKGPHPASEVEIQYMTAKLDEVRPLLFLDCHTEGGGDEITVGGSRRAWLKGAFDPVALATGASVRYTTQSTQSVARNYGDTVPSNSGGNAVSVLIEAGALLDEAEQIRLGVNALFGAVAYGAAWHRYRRDTLAPTEVFAA